MRKDFFTAYDEFNPRPVEQPKIVNSPVETFHPSEPAVEKPTEIIPDSVEVIPEPPQEEIEDGDERLDPDNK